MKTVASSRLSELTGRPLVFLAFFARKSLSSIGRESGRLRSFLANRYFLGKTLSDSLFEFTDAFSARLESYRLAGQR